MPPGPGRKTWPADKDIQTSTFSVSAQQDVDQQTGQPKGTRTYIANNTVKITIIIK